MPNLFYPVESIHQSQVQRLRHKVVLTPIPLMTMTAIFIVVTGNISFWLKVADIFPFSHIGNWPMYAALLLICSALIAILLSLTALVLPVRIVVSFYLIITAVVAYFTGHLGVIVDADMIRNVLQTDRAEVSDLWSSAFALRFISFGIIPVVGIWWVSFSQPAVVVRQRNTLVFCGANLLIVLLVVFSMSGYFTSLFREHKLLRYYLNPIYPIYSAIKFLNHQNDALSSNIYNTVAGYAFVPSADTKKELVIVVVGEAARADHFSVNGYHRSTNPELSREQGLISFSNVSACGTSTAVSVPCLFAFANRTTFDVEASSHIENVIDVLAKAGVSVLWRDNNSGSKGVADRITYQNFKDPAVNSECDEVECRDTGMLLGLQEYIDQQQQDILIVLHQMGSHGPAYYKRYPKPFEKFTPTCNTNDLGKCSKDEIINSYDNSIVYTDYFLSQVIQLLKENTPAFETTMFYIGDHGESLGERGLYLHGLPYALAPEEQVHVPLIVWAGDSSDIDYQRSLLLKDNLISHDAFSYGLLDIFEIESDIAEPQEINHFFAKL